MNKLQTAGVTFSRVFDFKESLPKITSYRASHSISIQALIESAGDIIDGVVKNGSTNVLNVAFKATDEVSYNVRLQAVDAAKKKAKMGAEAAADAANREVSEGKYGF